ncbi:VanZ family protein [Nitrospira sp. Ecomares 2.1]
MLLKYWGPVVLYALVIVYLSSQSNPAQQLHIPSFLFKINDKILHACEYGVLGILLYRAFKYTTPMAGNMGLAIICVIAFGISDEIHQWFVPQRQADIWDLVADTFGAAFLILGWVLITEKGRKRLTIFK